MGEYQIGSKDAGQYTPVNTRCIGEYTPMKGSREDKKGNNYLAL